jgi:hypothetical protein
MEEPSQPEPLDTQHVEAAIAIALKMARFKPTRGLLTSESDEICAKAARAVMEHFARAEWRVVNAGSYRGFTTGESFPSVRGKGEPPARKPGARAVKAAPGRGRGEEPLLLSPCEVTDEQSGISRYGCVKNGKISSKPYPALGAEWRVGVRWQLSRLLDKLDALYPRYDDALLLPIEYKREDDDGQGIEFFFQRAAAAFFAMAARSFPLSDSALALPPFRPRLTAALSLPSSFRSSSSSPVAILAILTALATTSAGRFSPFGPLGIQCFLTEAVEPVTKEGAGQFLTGRVNPFPT